MKPFSDAQRLAAMRALGVRWRQGRLPLYTARMSEEQKAQADKHYDAMSEAFVDAFCTKHETA